MVGSLFSIFFLLAVTQIELFFFLLNTVLILLKAKRFLIVFKEHLLQYSMPHTFLLDCRALHQQF